MDNRSLSHTRWKCQYHIVFIPKYRKRILAQILVDIKKEQDELKDILGSVAPPISALISVLPLFVT